MLFCSMFYTTSVCKMAFLCTSSWPCPINYISRGCGSYPPRGLCLAKLYYFSPVFFSMFTIFLSSFLPTENGGGFMPELKHFNLNLHLFQQGKYIFPLSLSHHSLNHVMNSLCSLATIPFSLNSEFETNLLLTLSLPKHSTWEDITQLHICLVFLLTHWQYQLLLDHQCQIGNNLRKV